MKLPDLTRLLELGERARRREVIGRIAAVRGLALEAVGIEAALGDLCMIHGGAGLVPAEVVGFGEARLVLMPIGESRGVAQGDPVSSTGKPIVVRAGEACLGRILDGLGTAMDGGPPVPGTEVAIAAQAPLPMQRPQIVQRLDTGVSAIDGFLTCGVGQRIGIFAGSGVGKSTLLGQIARDSSADVNVIALVGERGREVKDFVEDILGERGMARSVLVVATSDVPALLRFKATFTAIAIAEFFRDQGKQVLFMMDSVTRLAAAAREIGLAIGEPPTLRGYPPSLFSTLPKVVERLGTSGRGSITGMITVLVEGDDLNEPVSDTMRGLLDGHIVLDRSIAARGHYPAIDVLDSVSRLMQRVVPPEQLKTALELRALLANYEENRDLIQIGAHQAGADPELDRAIAAMPDIEAILYQGTVSRSSEDTWRLMLELSARLQHQAPGGIIR
ncbi:MAG: FliI/YscN family ATPase [Planctomycetota bacterium]